jgi:hypothetical protein
MLMGLLESPGDFLNHIRRYTTSLTTQMAFGYRTPESDDKNLLEMFEVCSKLQPDQMETPTKQLLVEFRRAVKADWKSGKLLVMSECRLP